MNLNAITETAKWIYRSASHAWPSGPEIWNKVTVILVQLGGIMLILSTPPPRAYLYVFLYLIHFIFLNQPFSMAERSKASTVFGRSNIGIAADSPRRLYQVHSPRKHQDPYWDRKFESCSGHGCVSAFFLCCVVLCRQRPCAGLIPPPRSPTKCLTDLRN
jgi:hypothetical protein